MIDSHLMIVQDHKSEMDILNAIDLTHRLELFHHIRI